MKGFRFYAEMPEDRKSKSASRAYPRFPWTVKQLKTQAGLGFRCDVVAVLLDDNGNPLWLGGASGLVVNSICVAIEGNAFSYGQGASHMDYIRKRTTRIPEELARKLSPELFRYLES